MKRATRPVADGARALRVSKIADTRHRPQRRSHRREAARTRQQRAIMCTARERDKSPGRELCVSLQIGVYQFELSGCVVLDSPAPSCTTPDTSPAGGRRTRSNPCRRAPLCREGRCARGIDFTHRPFWVQWSPLASLLSHGVRYLPCRGQAGLFKPCRRGLLCREETSVREI